MEWYWLIAAVYLAGFWISLLNTYYELTLQGHNPAWLAIIGATFWPVIAIMLFVQWAFIRLKRH